MANKGPMFKTGDYFKSGDSLVSANGIYCAYLFEDGNLCIYASPTPDPDYFLWHSKSQVALGPKCMYLHSDGNLCIYNSPTPDANTYIWGSGPAGSNSPQYAYLHDDGNLCIYNTETATMVWSSGPYGAIKMDSLGGPKFIPPKVVSKGGEDKFIFVDLPEHIENPEQANSIIEKGPETLVGEVHFTGAEVWDPLVDQALVILDTLPRIIDSAPQRPQLMALKRQGYKLVRTQWYEMVETFVISHGDTKERSSSLTLGTQHQTSHTTEKSVGFEFGISTTTTTSANMKVGLKFEGVGEFGGGVESSRSQTRSRKISQGLKVSQSDSSINSETKTITVKDTYTGGDNGARYIMWQVIDRIQLIRKSDNVIISDKEIRTYSQVNKFDFTKD